MLNKSLNFTLDELDGAIHALQRDPRQLLMSDLGKHIYQEVDLEQPNKTVSYRQRKILPTPLRTL